MTEETKEPELDGYDKMVVERIDLLKKAFDDFPNEEGKGDSDKLPSFIMFHIAQIYTRLDIALCELEDVKEVAEYGNGDTLTDEEYEKVKADCEADMKKLGADMFTIESEKTITKMAIDSTIEKFRQVFEQMEKELDHEPTAEDIANEMGLPVDKVVGLMKAMEEQTV